MLKIFDRLMRQCLETALKRSAWSQLMYQADLENELVAGFALPLDKNVELLGL